MDVTKTTETDDWCFHLMPDWLSENREKGFISLRDVIRSHYKNLSCFNFVFRETRLSLLQFIGL